MGSQMESIETKLEGTKLTLVIDLSQEPGMSTSGKSIKVATTEGNISVPGQEEIKMGVNIYKPRPR